MLKVKLLTSDAVFPRRAHHNDAGLDIYANEDIVIQPGETVAVRTGIAIQLPKNTMGAIDPRSGITAKTKLRVIHGTIDEGYTGEIRIIADNIAQPFHTLPFYKRWYLKCKGQAVNYGAYTVKKGDKIAQLVILPVLKPVVVKVESLDDSERGDNGFGSSGV